MRIESGLLGANYQTRLGVLWTRQHRQRNLCGPVNLLQHINISKLESPLRAGVHASRVSTSVAQGLAAVALRRDIRFWKNFRVPIGACVHTGSAARAQLVIVQNHPVFRTIHRSRRTPFDAGRLRAVIARARIGIAVNRRKGANAVGVRVAENHSHLETVLVFAGNLSGTASNAARHVEVEAQTSHNRPPSLPSRRCAADADSPLPTIHRRTSRNCSCSCCSRMPPCPKGRYR